LHSPQKKNSEPTRKEDHLKVFHSRRTRIRSIKNPKMKSKNTSEVFNHEMLGGLSMRESGGSPWGREKKI
jgi:hypothetical protein